MSKNEFLDLLRCGLSGLPQEDIDDRISFFAEMIDDKVEDGLSEEDAVSQIGSVDDVISRILEDIPLKKLIREKAKKGKKHMRGWELALLIAGSPLWFALLLTVFAVVLSVYVVLWAVIVSLWAVEVSFAACSLAGGFGGIALMINGDTVPGLVLFAAGLVLAGLSVFMFYGCRAATYGIIKLTKMMGLSVKRIFIKKEAA